MPTVFFAPRIWRKWTIIVALPVVVVLALALSKFFVPDAELLDEISVSYYVVLSVFVAIGLQLVVLAIRDIWSRRDHDSLLIFLWFVGTFAFAAFVNWSVNGRSLLPLAPVAGIIIERSLCRLNANSNGKGVVWPTWPRSYLVPFACALIISMVVTWADYSQAGTVRQAAQEISRNYQGKQPLIFQGHWGFQYYMQQERKATAWDKKKAYPQSFVMVVPINNTNCELEFPHKGPLVAELNLPYSRFVSTSDFILRAGFYSSSLGELPFAMGNVATERYVIFSSK